MRVTSEARSSSFGSAHSRLAGGAAGTLEHTKDLEEEGILPKLAGVGMEIEGLEVVGLPLQCADARGLLVRIPSKLLRMDQLMDEIATRKGRGGIKIIGQQDLTGRGNIDSSDDLAMSLPRLVLMGQAHSTALAGRSAHRPPGPGYGSPPPQSERPL
jgi:hypothetical protein